LKTLFSSKVETNYGLVWSINQQITTHSLHHQSDVVPFYKFLVKLEAQGTFPALFEDCKDDELDWEAHTLSKARTTAQFWSAQTALLSPAALCSAPSPPSLLTNALIAILTASAHWSCGLASPLVPRNWRRLVPHLL
jgi:hypothetical protein